MQSRAAGELGITKLLPQKLSEMFLPVSLEIDLPLCIADKTNQRRTRCPLERSPLAATNSGHRSSILLFFGLVHFLQEPLECAPAFDAGLVLDAL